jgi:hypothetical protein
VLQLGPNVRDERPADIEPIYQHFY